MARDKLMPEVLETPTNVDSDQSSDRETGSLAAAIRDSEPDSEHADHTQLGRLNRCPSPLKHPILCSYWLIKAAFGLASLVLFLAVLAAIPIINLFVLGYLLDVQGRIARTGRLTKALPLLDLAPRFGSIVVGLTLFLFPLSLLASAASDAELIQAGSRTANTLGFLRVVAAIAVALHLGMALARGGGLSCFFRPIKNARWLIAQLRQHQYIDQSAVHLSQFVRDMNLGYYFSMGFRGFVGAAIWLLPATAVYAAAEKPEGGAVVVTVLGGLMLVVILCWLPILQTRFAAENRFKAFFEIGEVRRQQRKAPALWLLAYLVTFAFSIPLYLFKVISPPQDAMFFITLIFLVTIYPCKLLLGWVYYWSSNRTKTPSVFWRLPWKTTSLLAVGIYVFVLFFTQFIGEQGKTVLFQNHTFLLPSPF